LAQEGQALELAVRPMTAQEATAISVEEVQLEVAATLLPVEVASMHLGVPARNQIPDQEAEVLDKVHPVREEVHRVQDQAHHDLEASRLVLGEVGVRHALVQVEEALFVAAAAAAAVAEDAVVHRIDLADLAEEGA